MVCLSSGKCWNIEWTCRWKARGSFKSVWLILWRTVYAYYHTVKSLQSDCLALIMFLGICVHVFECMFVHACLQCHLFPPSSVFVLLVHNNTWTQVVTDVSVVSGTPSLEIKPGHSAPYSLTVLPWKRGKQTGDFFFPTACLWLYGFVVC